MDKESQELSNMHTDTLMDMLALQERQLAQIYSTADEITRRQRHIKAHMAAHKDEIDFAMVFTGERRG